MPTNSTRFTGKGRLCADPRIHVTSNNAMVAGMSIAFDDDRKVTDNQGAETWLENTIFMWCEGWNKLAARIADDKNGVRKGDLVFVEGRIKQSRYTPEGEDKEVTITKVWLDSLQLISRPKQKDNTTAASQADAEEANQAMANGMTDVPF